MQITCNQKGVDKSTVNYVVNDGIRAFRLNKLSMENPFPVETVEHSDWNNGWFQALRSRNFHALR